MNDVLEIAAMVRELDATRAELARVKAEFAEFRAWLPPEYHKERCLRSLWDKQEVECTCNSPRLPRTPENMPGPGIFLP